MEQNWTKDKDLSYITRSLPDSSVYISVQVSQLVTNSHSHFPILSIGIREIVIKYIIRI